MSGAILRWGGDLCWNERTVSLQLEPGEIAVLGGPNESFRPLQKTVKTIELPDELPVRWECDNMLLLPRGASFRWNNSTELPRLRLLVPQAGAAITLDGQPVGEEKPKMFLDQPYREILLPEAGGVGLHMLELRSIADSPTDPIYLTGDFDVHIKTAGDFCAENFRYYSMSLYYPSSYEVTLSPRSKTLRTGSWAEQGAPFYSGTATYLMDIEHKGGLARLVLPEVNYVCSLRCDGVEIGQRIWPPYEFEWELPAGRHTLELVVHNSMANMMEGYRAPGGLAGPTDG